MRETLKIIEQTIKTILAKVITKTIPVETTKKRRINRMKFGNGLC